MPSAAELAADALEAASSGLLRLALAVAEPEPVALPTQTTVLDSAAVADALAVLEQLSGTAILTAAVEVPVAVTDAASGTDLLTLAVVEPVADIDPASATAPAFGLPLRATALSGAPFNRPDQTTGIELPH